jgi:hypothetical protein
MKRFRILKVLGILLIVAVVFGVLSFVVMQLWNNVLAVVLHIGLVTFWQAAGILLLSKILFGFGGKGFRKHHHSPEAYEWRRKMMGKWKDMTPEERKKFRQNFRDRCRQGWHGGFEEQTRGEQAQAGEQERGGL